MAFSKTIYDGKGNILGFEREIEGYGTEVDDAGGNRLGSTTVFGTFDNQANRLSDAEDAGLLMRSERK
jgi:hypothetical protein